MSGIVWTVKDDPGWWTEHVASFGLFTLTASEYPDEGDGVTFSWSVDFARAQFPELDHGEDEMVSGDSASLDAAKQSAVEWMLRIADHAAFARDGILMAVAE